MRVGAGRRRTTGEGGGVAPPSRASRFGGGASSRCRAFLINEAALGDEIAWTGARHPIIQLDIQTVHPPNAENTVGLKQYHVV